MKLYLISYWDGLTRCLPQWIQMCVFSVFHRNTRPCQNVYDITYYGIIRKYLLFLGLDPYQQNVISHIAVSFILLNVICAVLPQFLGVFMSLYKKDVDMMYDSLPHFFVSMICLNKVLNVYCNQQTFKKLFSLVREEWKTLRDDELQCLEEITKRGSRIAQLYRTCLYSFMTIYLFLPLVPCVLDIILPLNETRPRKHFMHVEYLFFDGDQYFFPVYFQLSFAVVYGTTMIITVDSLYITIIHHASGVFAVCGSQIQEAAEMVEADGTTFTGNGFERFRRCFITHKRAIQFYEMLRNVSTKCYLFQVGISMLGISVTVVQLVSNLGRPRDAARAALLLSAKQFHLFVVSLPGQVLLDHCSDLALTIYCCKWYTTPVKIQKMIQVMQVRSNTPCHLTAGGLYTLSMENFGTTLKACMSYVTMLLSLME